MAETPRLAYYDLNIPCLAACPVNTNAGAYVAAIAEGRDLSAYLTARLPNPFASVCGRVCAAPCEDACRRGTIDSPIAIRALKRFVTEQFGPEAAGDQHITLLPRSPDRGESVGIVGGGPAGLAAAHDLRRHGYAVTVYEATERLGGMMVLGIPEYRLDRELVEAEIRAILDLGVEVHTGVRIGRDVGLTDLVERHDAVVLAFGATLGRGLDIPGNEADGVLRAMEFLINMNRGFQVEVGERVVVVGGGNVAMDAARTALRAAAYGYDDDADSEAQEPGTGHDLTEAVDVARTAVRAGATDVTVVALESLEEMPAAAFEIEEAKIEGIRFVHRRGPHRIEVEDGRVAGLTTVRALSVFDSRGRFAPEFDFDDLEELPADTVILAIGQAVDVAALGESGPELTPRRTVAIDEETMATTQPGVWAAGDAARGPRNLIDAVADGRSVAADIHRTFSGEVPPVVTGSLVTNEAFHRVEDIYDRIPRQEPPTLASNRRIGLREVELGFTEEQARREANRCLRCFANIQLDVGSCVLCGLCVDVCPFDLISIVPAGYVEPGGVGTALVLDESRCIRCGLCIDRCPSKALSMGAWVGLGALEVSSIAEGAGVRVGR
jgi:formate dehydrogenase beta subunit